VFEKTRHCKNSNNVKIVHSFRGHYIISAWVSEYLPNGTSAHCRLFSHEKLFNNSNKTDNNFNKNCAKVVNSFGTHFEGLRTKCLRLCDMSVEKRKNAFFDIWKKRKKYVGSRTLVVVGFHIVVEQLQCIFFISGVTIGCEISAVVGRFMCVCRRVLFRTPKNEARSSTVQD